MLGLVTSEEFPRLYEGEAPLLEALRRAGVAHEAVVWDDPGVEWGRYGALLLRNPWDYYRKAAAFRGWLGRVEAAGARLINPLETVRRNMHKGYLMALGQAGVPTIPTRAWPEGASADEVLEGVGGEELVIKPAVSAGGWRTSRVRRGDAAGVEAALAEVRQDGGEALVQPFLPQITGFGELSFVFFGGVYSHAVKKTAAPGKFLIHDKHGGKSGPYEASAAEVEAARRALDRFGGAWTYARVDVVPVDGALWVMELELIEPELFLPYKAGAAEALVEALGL
jgi:glutathione synthase/RimK-type ligase-like ATP-grasp enzyme